MRSRFSGYTGGTRSAHWCWRTAPASWIARCTSGLCPGPGTQPPPTPDLTFRPYSLYRCVKNWYAWLEKTSCFSASAEVQYPKPKHEKEPFWPGGGSGCRAWSRRALWPHVWPQTASEHTETVELRASKSVRNAAELVKLIEKYQKKISSAV